MEKIRRPRRNPTLLLISCDTGQVTQSTELLFPLKIRTIRSTNILLWLNSMVSTNSWQGFFLLLLAKFFQTTQCSCYSNNSFSLLFHFPPTDRNLATDMTPKPTVFLPSIAEIEHSKVGTYLCLLEKCFPNAIQVYWKEKNDNRVLESMQGNTVKTDDTYMKFSWLTVSEESMGKEHICFVKHEKNRVEPVQEILFPSINEGM